MSMSLVLLVGHLLAMPVTGWAMHYQLHRVAQGPIDQTGWALVLFFMSGALYTVNLANVVKGVGSLCL
jgi:hypothetical protein